MDEQCKENHNLGSVILGKENFTYIIYNYDKTVVSYVDSNENLWGGGNPWNTCHSARRN